MATNATTTDTDSRAGRGEIELRMMSPHDELEDANLPHLSTFIPQSKFWIKVSTWPALYVILNCIFVFTLVWIQDGYDNYSMSPEYDARWAHLVQRSFGVLSVVLFVDAYFVYKSALLTERQVYVLEQQEDGNILTNVFGRLSRMVDKFLSKGRAPTPKVSFLVNALFTYFTINLILGVLSLTCLGAVILSSTCIAGKDASVQTTPLLQQLNVSTKYFSRMPFPPHSQYWFKEMEIQHSLNWIKKMERQVGKRFRSNFVHTLDGWTFFSGREDGNDEVLVAVGPHGEVQPMAQLRQPHSLVLLPDNTTFCCLYRTIADDDDFESRSGGPIQGNNIFCKDTSANLKNTTIPGVDNLSQTDCFLIVQDGVLWIMSRWVDPSRRRRRLRLQDVWLLASIDPRTMNLTRIERVEMDPDNEYDMFFPPYGEACAKHLSWISVSLGMVLAFVAGGWMWLQKELPSAVTPVCIASQILATMIDNGLGYYLSYIVCAVILVSLMTRRPSYKDVKLWSMYTIVLVMLLMEQSPERGNKTWVLDLALLFLITVMLDHPLCQVMSGQIAIVAVGMCFVALASGDAEVVEEIPVAIVASFGLASMGYTLSKYRTYISIYARRIWRSVMTAAPSSNRHRSHSDDGDMNQARSREHETMKAQVVDIT